MAQRTGDLRRRVASWVWDYLVVVVWLVFLFIAIGIPQLAGWLDLDSVWSQPARFDLAITVLTVLPFAGYLILTESGASRATWGKRRAMLMVRSVAGEISLSRVVRRNIVKVLPWQLGHMSSVHFASGEGPTWVALTLFASSVILLASIVAPILLGRRGLHDLFAGTAVGSAA